MAITTGGRLESHMLTPLPAGTAETSLTCQRCLHFGFSNSTFKFPTDPPFLALPTLFLWLNHIKGQLVICAVQTPCPLMLGFLVDESDHPWQPFSAWMSPKLLLLQALCQFHILDFSF